MTDVESGRARELVGRAGNHAPPMPDFDSIVARANPDSPVTPSPTPRRHFILVAAVTLFLVSGAALAWWAQGQDTEQILAGENGNPSPSVPATWTRDSWPVLVGVEDLELRYALAGLAKSIGYTGPEGMQITIEVFAELFDDEPGPFSEAIEVNGDPGWIETSTDGDQQTSTSLHWSRDGFQFFLTISGSPSTDEAIEIAESVVPTPEDDLPVAVVSGLGLGTGPRFDVATATVRGEQVTLQATSPEGYLFFLWLGPEGGGGGPTFLGPNSLLQVQGSSGLAYPGHVVYGLVDQSVGSLSLRLSDGSRENVEIQSRSLGYEAAFFLTIVQAPDTAVAIEAYGEDETLLQSFDIPVFVGAPRDLEARGIDPRLAGPPIVGRLQASIEEFATDTLGWDLTQDSIEEIDPGLAFVVTDPETGSQLRITIAPDGRGISAVTPESSDLTVAVDIAGNSIAVSFDGADPDVSSATLQVATRASQIQRTLTETQLAEGSITVDLSGLTDEANLDYLLLFEDQSGHVISAFSPS